MGTDFAGRDVLSRIMWGARPSLQVGLLSVLIGLPGGLAIGLLAGFYRGSMLETVLMRATEIIAAVPLLIVAIAVVGVLGVKPVALGPLTITNEVKIVFVLGFSTSRASPAWCTRWRHRRRCPTISGRDASRGVGDFSLMVGDILPNCLSVVTVWATLLTAGGVLAEAGLSFVGLGVQPPDASWGVMLSEARKFIFSGEWWLLLFPGLFISITVIGLNLFGDALRDILDPRHYTGPEARLMGGRLLESGGSAGRVSRRRAHGGSGARGGLCNGDRQALGVLGESGSGKSVSALSVMRLIQAPGRITGGAVRFGGARSAEPGGERDAGPSRARDLDGLPGPADGIQPGLQGRAAARARHPHPYLPLREGRAGAPAMEVLGLVGLPDPRRVMRAYPHELSGGMRQRASSAWPLLRAPAADRGRATTALDVTVQAQIVELFHDLRARLDLSLIYIRTISTSWPSSATGPS